MNERNDECYHEYDCKYLVEYAKQGDILYFQYDTRKQSNTVAAKVTHSGALPRKGSAPNPQAGASGHGRKEAFSNTARSMPRNSREAPMAKHKQKKSFAFIGVYGEQTA